MLDALSLEPARPEDADFLLTLRNDPGVVTASRIDREVTRAEHRAWLTSTIASPVRRLFVVRAAAEPIGQARLDVIDEVEWVSIALVREQRGRGRGFRVLRLLQGVAKADLIAEVRVENLASIALFESADFECERVDDGFAVLRWRLRPDELSDEAETRVSWS